LRRGFIPGRCCDFLKRKKIRNSEFGIWNLHDLSPLKKEVRGLFS